MVGHQVVAFDLFETLVTEYTADWQPGPSNAERLGVPQQCYAAIWRTRKAQRMTSSVDFRDVLREICDVAGIVLDRRIGEIIETLYAERLGVKARSLTQVDDRILAALRELRSSGIALALISNCSIEDVAAWETSALAPLFDDVAFSYRESFAKPDPAIYLASCSRLGVDPATVAFVGDGGDHELDGASRAGLTAYRARWFLDRWPTAIGAARGDAVRSYPTLAEPQDLVATFGQPGRASS